jgi:hypothetical protein
MCRLTAYKEEAKRRILFGKMDEAMRIDNWRNMKKALRQYNCREMDIRFEPESDSGLINEEKSGYQPLQKTKGLRIKFAGNKKKEGRRL